MLEGFDVINSFSGCVAEPATIAPVVQLGTQLSVGERDDGDLSLFCSECSSGGCRHLGSRFVVRHCLGNPRITVSQVVALTLGFIDICLRCILSLALRFSAIFACRSIADLSQCLSMKLAQWLNSFALLTTFLPKFLNAQVFDVRLRAFNVRAAKLASRLQSIAGLIPQVEVGMGLSFSALATAFRRWNQIEIPWLLAAWHWVILGPFLEGNTPMILPPIYSSLLREKRELCLR